MNSGKKIVDIGLRGRTRDDGWVIERAVWGQCQEENSIAVRDQSPAVAMSSSFHLECSG